MLGSRNYDSVTKTWSGYNWQSYRQVDQRVNAFGSGVMHINEAVLGNTQLNRWSLGIWSLNRPEWFISEMICNYYNLVSVPLYETLGPDAVEFVMNHAEIKVAVVSGMFLFVLFFVRSNSSLFFCHSQPCMSYIRGIHSKEYVFPSLPRFLFALTS